MAGVQKIKNIAFCLVLGLTQCAPTVTYFNWTAPDHDYKRFNKVAVFGITRDLQDANDFEMAMSNRLRKRNYVAVSGMSLSPPELMKNLDVKGVRKHLLSKGVEGVLSLAVVNVSSHSIYVQGSVFTAPVEQRRFGSNYITTYQNIYQPGYYAQAGTYIYEANFYDLTSEDVDNNLIWTYQYKFDSDTREMPALLPFNKQLMVALKTDKIL